jgi:hypothetical protein
MQRWVLCTTGAVIVVIASGDIVRGGVQVGHDGIWPRLNTRRLRGAMSVQCAEREWTNILDLKEGRATYSRPTTPVYVLHVP